MTLILAFDPGLANLGYALVSDEKNVIRVRQLDTITTSSKDPLEKRLLHLGEGIKELIRISQPTSVCTESVFLNMNQKSVMNVAMVIGLIGYFAACYSIPFYSYSPLQIKQAVTGQGRASKEQVQKILEHLFPAMRSSGAHHASDAVAVAYCHLRMAKFKKSVVS